MLQAAIYYLPTVKNPLNVALLSTEIIHSPHIFPVPGTSPSFEIDLTFLSLIIDGFEASATRKASITDPTLSPKEWTHEIYKSFEYLKPEHQWRALPVISGLIKAIHYQELRQNLLLNGETSRPAGVNIDSGPLSDKHLKRILHREFVKLVNTTLRIYGQEKYLLSENEQNNTQIPIAIFVSAVTLPFLDESEAKNLDYGLLLSYSVKFVYLSDQGLQGGRCLRSILVKDDKSLAIALDTNPIFTKLNSLSMLIQKSIQEINSHKSPIPAVEALETIYQFSISLSDEWNAVTANIGDITQIQNDTIAWNFLKICLFSVSLVFQGYTTWVLLTITRTEFRNRAIPITSLILRSFSNMYFIVAQISLAGFPTFDFVYYTAIDILLDPQFEYTEICKIVKDFSFPIISLQDHQRNIYLSQSLVFRGKLIFLLNICETLVPLLPPKRTFENRHCPITLTDDIIPLVSLFLQPLPISPETQNLTLSHIRPILESAHSVMLAMITTPAQVAEVGAGNHPLFLFKDSELAYPEFVNSITPKYFRTIRELFPAVLSSTQFSLAITTLVRSLSPPSPIFLLDSQSAEQIITELIEESDKIGVGILLPSQNTSKSQQGHDLSKLTQQDSSAVPPTVRAVILSSVIHSLPYLDVSVLEKYLTLIWKKIDQTIRLNESSSIAIANEEQRYLEIDMFNMIAKDLEQRKASVGIRWWYNKSTL